MSSKRPNIVELHCEKMLVGIVGLFLVAVAVWQIVFVQIQVKVGSERVALPALQEKLERKEGDLSRKLDPSGASPLDIPEAKQVSAAAIFEAERVRAVAPANALVATEPSFGKLLTGGSVSNSQWFYDPKFPPPRMEAVVVSTDAFDMAAIGDETLSANREFFTPFVSPATADVTWATPWVVVDLASMRAELSKEDRTQRPAREALPRPWFKDTLFIVDLVFERQQKDSGGNWQAPTVVGSVPGQESWRPAVESPSSNASTRDTVFANLADFDMQLDVLQPQLFPMKKNNFQAPALDSAPIDPLLAAAEQARRSAERKCKSVAAELAKLEEQLKAAGGPLAPPPGEGGKSGGTGAGGGGLPGGGGGFGGGMGGGGGGLNKRDVVTGADEGAKDLRIRLTRRVDQKGKELRKLNDAYLAKYPAAPKGDSSANDLASKNLKTLPEIVAWTHDFGVRAGATYRYRATMKVYNPFFTRKILLVPDQENLSKSLAVSSLSSDWGEEIEIPLPTTFFMTRGTAREGIGGRRLSIELFRFSDGELRSTAEDVVPGDIVGKSSVQRDDQTDFSTPWYLVDIFDDEGTDKNGGVVALFGRRDESGAIHRETRTVAGDIDSQKYRDLKQAVAMPAPKPDLPKNPKT